jgi:long-chain acyl-CoA synthetase
MLNITTFLDANACRIGKAVFHCPERGTRYTSAEVLSIASELARGLQARGVGKGDRAMLYMDSSPEYLFSYFALWRLGAVAVPCNRVYTVNELRYVAENSGAKICVTDAAGAKSLEALEGLETFVPGDVEAMRKAPVLPVCPTEPDDLCQLQYTSGTTGKPKGAMLTHANWYAGIANECDVLTCRQFDSYLGIYPMGHVGLSWGIAAMRAGACYTMMARFKLDEYLRLCREEGVTVLSGMPPVIHSLVNCPAGTEEALKTVREIISGGGPLHCDVWKKFHLRYGIPVLNAYGLSETVVVGTGTVIRPEDYVSADRFESVGHPVCFSEVKIVDELDASKELPRGEAGEVALRGPATAKGYWRMPEETAAAFLPDGWFLTGDVGYLDADNRLFITDRKKDMIVMSGWKIYPTEVEEVLIRHAAVKDVAVFGLPDEHKGEMPAVAVVWKEGPEEESLLELARENLAGYKVPRKVFSVDALPRVNGWKLLRRSLREQFKA